MKYKIGYSKCSTGPIEADVVAENEHDAVRKLLQYYENNAYDVERIISVELVDE